MACDNLEIVDAANKTIGIIRSHANPHDCSQCGHDVPWVKA
jgi:hypothetical protein